eukprot:11217160-Lingulodinium_polyedra.AAC.1
MRQRLVAWGTNRPAAPQPTSNSPASETTTRGPTSGGTPRWSESGHASGPPGPKPTATTVRLSNTRGQRLLRHS